MMKDERTLGKNRLLGRRRMAHSACSWFRSIVRAKLDTLEPPFIPLVSMPVAKRPAETPGVRRRFSAESCSACAPGGCIFPLEIVAGLKMRRVRESALSASPLCPQMSMYADIYTND